MMPTVFVRSVERSARNVVRAAAPGCVGVAPSLHALTPIAIVANNTPGRERLIGPPWKGLTALD
jgi:hypothetical protein